MSTLNTLTGNQKVAEPSWLQAASSKSAEWRRKLADFGQKLSKALQTINHRGGDPMDVAI
jgi:hypothetical protein